MCTVWTLNQVRRLYFFQLKVTCSVKLIIGNGLLSSRTAAVVTRLYSFPSNRTTVWHHHTSVSCNKVNQWITQSRLILLSRLYVFNTFYFVWMKHCRVIIAKSRLQHKLIHNFSMFNFEAEHSTVAVRSIQCLYSLYIVLYRIITLQVRAVVTVHNTAQWTCQWTRSATESLTVHLRWHGGVQVTTVCLVVDRWLFSPTLEVHQTTANWLTG